MMMPALASHLVAEAPSLVLYVFAPPPLMLSPSWAIGPDSRAAATHPEEQQ